MPGFITTAEIRWFTEGTVPEDIDTLFNKSDTTLYFAERKDIYLVFPKSSRVSLKWREGRLEIKSMVQELEPYVFHEMEMGKITVWEKWGNNFPADNPGSLMGSSGIEVYKQRSLTGLTMMGEKISRISPDKIFYETDYGCTLELSSVRIYGRTFWSVNLECWDNTDSPAIRLTEFLDYYFTELLHGIEGLRHFFHAGNAWSYPRFLQEF